MRIAIVGGGSIGWRHAGNARMLGHDVDVYDVNPERDMSRAGSQPEHADAVMICTPASTHATVAHWLLHVRNYQGPLFVEKPLALRSDEEVFRTWPHPVTMVGYNWRFHPEIAPLQALAGGGTVHFECRTDITAWPGRAYADPLLECSHEIDLALAWLGEPSAITGGSLDGGNGAWVQMQQASGSSVVDVRWRATQARKISFRLPGWTLVEARPSSEAEAPALQRSYRLELRHFLACVELNAPTCCPFDQGLRVVEICQRVKELAT